ncbi:sulfite exporter TauE/SafE family protein [Streptosporangium sp. NBC_01756]|uniref:sulfite exporter TauE/SafE family protein n=1 Tax=Streptosporangium sp. NBC_01756 TaxID=2975950 RepID=UPI002DD8FF4F|nr:sulfite exporter TauE/SafE family protein [Streptosporangium sp. NBC_01756]WSC90614.1 sulfite exporter TauE/SafE family protein [Streptosporangium sp. NBC_01756]
MTPWEIIAIFVAGVAAGGINAVVGSGSLITFPTMVALGIPPIVANVSNNIGLVPGSLTGALGYRAELGGQRDRLIRLGAASVAGSLIGGVLLLFLPVDTFDVVVPILIGLACVLVVIQPRLNRWLSARREDPHPHGGPWLWVGVFAAGIYGGYFGAAQGVLLIGLLGSFLDDDLQRVNAAKNVLSLLVNGTAAILFIAVAEVDWRAVALVALGATIGGFLGAKVGRKLPAPVLRGFIVCIGILAIVKLVYG